MSHPVCENKKIICKTYLAVLFRIKMHFFGKGVNNDLNILFKSLINQMIYKIQSFLNNYSIFTIIIIHLGHSRKDDLLH